MLQDSEPQGAIDLRAYVVVKTPECGRGTHKFAFKLVKYGTRVDQHYFHCQTEYELIR